MSDLAQFIEVLSVARVRTDQEQPAVVVTVRPQPDRSWAFQHLALSWNQAERLKTDLETLLKTPATFLLLAIVALTTGCSAKVEVVSEKSAAVEADSVEAPPVAALEKQSVVVDVDFLGQSSEPAVKSVVNEQPMATTEPVPVNVGGIQVNGNENSIEFHYHRHRRPRYPAIVYPIIRHEMIIVPGDGTAPVRFSDNAPPRIALVDKEVARAYAAHMLRLAKQEGF